MGMRFPPLRLSSAESARTVTSRRLGAGTCLGLCVAVSWLGACTDVDVTQGVPDVVRSTDAGAPDARVDSSFYWGLGLGDGAAWLNDDAFVGPTEDASLEAAVPDDASLPDAGMEADASSDAAASDSSLEAGTDAGDATVSDTGVEDSAIPDTGTSDTGIDDASTQDARAQDAGSLDAAGPDSGGVDSGTPDASTAPEPPAGAVLCAAEDQVCQIPAGVVATVWYGTGQDWIALTEQQGAVSCDNATFTDPIVGFLKECRYAQTGSVAVTTP